jgi:hypothetical protein
MELAELVQVIYCRQLWVDPSPDATDGLTMAENWFLGLCNRWLRVSPTVIQRGTADGIELVKLL